jgi:hypothetical protein
MGEAIGQAPSPAVGVALSPVPILAVILMLVTSRARKRPGVRRWLACWARRCRHDRLVGRGAERRGREWRTGDLGEPAEARARCASPSCRSKQWRRRPHEGEAATPKWMGAIDSFTRAKSLGAGALLAGANPKNLLLAVAAAAIAQTEIPGAEQALAYAIFAVIGTVGVAAPVVIYFGLGDRSGPILDRLKDWMGQNNAAIMAVLCLVLGAKIIGDAISGLAA